MSLGQKPWTARSTWAKRKDQRRLTTTMMHPLQRLQAKKGRHNKESNFQVFCKLHIRQFYY